MFNRGSICRIPPIEAINQINQLVEQLIKYELVEPESCKLDIDIDNEGCMDFTLQCDDKDLEVDSVLQGKKNLPAKLYVPAWKNAGETSPFPKPERPKFDVSEVVGLSGSIHEGGDNLTDVVPRYTERETQGWGDTLLADVKYRGNRGLIVVHNGQVEIYSSHLERKTELENKFSNTILSELPKDVNSIIMDSELYVLDPDGKPVEQGLQTGYLRAVDRSDCPQCQFKIEVFDIPILNDKDIRTEPLWRRKKLVDQLIDNSGILQKAELNYIPNTLGALTGQYIEDRQHKREGTVFKRLYPTPFSHYFIGKDANRWLKQKVGDTLDLTLKRLELYPSPEKQAPYGYRRLILAPSDAPEKEMPVANPITGQVSKYNVKWWKEKTADLYDRAIREGWKMSPTKHRVADTMNGRLPDFLPEWIEVPFGEEVVEVYAEEISKDLGISSPKFVAFRGKKRAETVDDIKRVRRMFY